MKAIHFQIGNTTTLSYLVKMGGTKNNYLIELAKEMWKYLLLHGITITAEYLQSSINVEAEWKLKVETPSTSTSEKLSDQRKTRDGCFCFLTVSTTSTVYCMETKSMQSGNGCNAANLVQSVPLCFLTFFSDKQGLKKNNPGAIEKNVDSSSRMVVSSMVPNPSENLNRETTSFTTPPKSSIKPPGSDACINNKQNIKVSGLDSFRQRLLATGVSERASKFISITRRQGSLSNCNSPWSKWASWCGGRKTDPFGRAIGNVLDYYVTFLI